MPSVTFEARTSNASHDWHASVTRNAHDPQTHLAMLNAICGWTKYRIKPEETNQ